MYLLLFLSDTKEILFICSSKFFTFSWVVWKYRNLKLFQNFDCVLIDITDNCSIFVDMYITIKKNSS